MGSAAEPGQRWGLAAAVVPVFVGNTARGAVAGRVRAPMYARSLLVALALTACASHSPPPPPRTAPAPTAASTPAPALYANEPTAHGESARRALSTAAQQLQAGQFDEAVSTLRAALDAAPDEPVLRLRLAVLLTEDGHADDAVQLLRAGLTQRPDDADLLTLAGGIRLRQALDGATVERHRGEVTTRPSTDAAAEARLVRTQLEQARDAFAEALRARENHLGALEGSAVVASRLDQHTEAARTWQRIVDATHDPDATENLARAVAAANDHDRARTLLESLVRDAPDRSTAWALLAAEYTHAGRADDARDATARGRFYQWIAPFTLAPEPAHLRDVTALAAWFPEGDAQPSAAEREAAANDARAVLTRLASEHTPAARTLLAAFAWHHSNDALEALAWEGLRAHGPDAGDTVLDLVQRAESSATMRLSLATLAAIRDPRAFRVLATVLPRDTGLLPLDAAGALDALGDPRAIELLTPLAERPAPPPPPDAPMGLSGGRSARARAVLALGAFDTPAVRTLLTRLVTEREIDLEAHAALYRLTRDRAHLTAIERVSDPVARSRAVSLLTGYVARIDTPEARAAAARAQQPSPATPAPQGAPRTPAPRRR